MPEPLSQPIVTSMRTTESLAPEDSLDRAASLLRHTAYPFVPILEGDRLVGGVSESGLASALADGHDLGEPCTNARFDPPRIAPTATGAEGLRRMNVEGTVALLVVDEADRVIGIVGPSDLTPQRGHTPTPPTIGGMATPFGVYLTTGTISGGAGTLALMSTGALLFGLFLAADRLAVLMAEAWPATSGFAGFASAAIFLVSMRLIPLSGTHAAEHMVVHAIERGEELTLEIVRRMPRVHPRCGTNLAVGAALFIGLFNFEWTSEQELRLLLAFLATVILYRPLGSLVQFWITTKEPTDKQIASGIRAGRELLERYRLKRGPVPSTWQRIVNSGMVQVAIGSTGVYLILKTVVILFRLPIDL